jgi:ATP synthase protein I
MSPKSKGDNPWQAAGMVGIMGVDIAVCILLGYYIGNYLGSQFGGSKGWVIGGVLIGLLIGIVSCILVLKKVMEDPDG